MNVADTYARLTTDEKRKCLKELGEKRKKDRWDGFNTIGDFGDVHDSDHDHVSPYTKGADNVDSEIMVILQDWASAEDLNNPFDESSLAQAIGYTPTAPTNRNLEIRLARNFDLKIEDIYATNLFPFVKSGATSASIPYGALKRAALVYAKPQIEIVHPRLVIVLGHLPFWAIAEAFGQKGKTKLKDSNENPLDRASGFRVWCQAHTSRDAASMGNTDNVNAAWAKMAEWYYKRED